MNGGAGKDQLTGGAGNDRLTGGADSDIFVFSKVAGGTGHDTIMDFQHGIDDIRFVGLSAAHRMANLAITHTPDGTWHVAYNDGIGKAVIDVHFTGAHLLTADDFIFLYG